jgi:hypothetical protein
MILLHEWKFQKAVDRNWQWVREPAQPSGKRQTSTRTFRTLLEAVNDAVLHGYLPPGHATPRKQKPQKPSGPSGSGWDALHVSCAKSPT